MIRIAHIAGTSPLYTQQNDRGGTYENFEAITLFKLFAARQTDNYSAYMFYADSCMDILQIGRGLLLCDVPVFQRKSTHEPVRWQHPVTDCRHRRIHDSPLDCYRAAGIYMRLPAL